MTILQNCIKDDHFKYLPKKRERGLRFALRQVLYAVSVTKSYYKWLGSVGKNISLQTKK